MNGAPDQSEFDVKEIPEKSGCFVKLYSRKAKTCRHMVRESQEDIGEYGGAPVIDDSEVSAPEKRIMCAIVPETPELPFPMRELPMRHGPTAMEYDIPDEAKEDVLKEVYPFEQCPGLTERRFDIHEEKFFQVSEFKVIRQFGRNLLVSPYYPLSGGMAVDWMNDDAENVVVTTVRGSAQDDGD